jgi:hypothetical protein
MFINCSTSPSAITLVASASTSSTRMRLTDTIIWKAREYRKSPTSTLAALPNMALAVARPRRSDDSSTTSSCSSVAVWMNSTVAASSCARALEAQRLRKQQHQARPDALAAGADDVGRDLVDQRHRDARRSRITASTCRMSASIGSAGAVTAGAVTASRVDGKVDCPEVGAEL